MNAQSSPLALKPCQELHWYRIERVLGQGAFGITYLAHDVNLDRQVAIKEYLPGQCSVRKTDLTVGPVSAEQQEDFAWGLKRFISEARILTKFEHPNLVRVLNVFEMNQTAYMVMNYEVGKSLQQILKSRGVLNESEIRKILLPLMSGLELMHAKGFVHRDIKPGNIFIRGDGSPVLLDFGSARQTRITPGRGASEEQQTLTTLVSPGYAPIEQYGSRSDRQGPWTDIYGLGATLYRAITGLIPVAAVDRGEAIMHNMEDPYLALTEAYKDRYSKNFLVAIDRAMAFKSQDRPQSIDAWRREFGFSENESVTMAGSAVTSAASRPAPAEAEAATFNSFEKGLEKTEKIDSQAETVGVTARLKPGRVPRNRKIIAAGVAAVFVLVGAVAFMGRDKEVSVTEAPAPEIQGEIPLVEQDAMPATEETPPATAAADADQARQDQIRELLARAEEDIKALRLTGPRDNNAFDKYLAVLKLDENNEAAHSGIQSITDKYVTMAYNAMESNKLDRAGSYLKKASAITPGSEKVAKAEEALQARRAEQQAAGAPAKESAQTTTTAESAEESNDSFWDKVKKWDQENVEKSKQTTKEGPSVDDHVKKAFGQ